MSLFSTAPKSICVLRLSAIGDVCHALAAVQAIQQHWPETEITWITGKIEAQLLEGLPGIELIVFDKSQGYTGMKSVWARLKHKKFDALVHMQAALRASVLSIGIKAQYRLGFSKNRTREAQWWFTNQHLPNTDVIHVLDNFMAFTHYLGVPQSEPSWTFPISQQDHLWAKEHIPDNAFVISPSASKASRNWSIEGYVSAAKHSHNRGFQVVLCGSPAPNEVKLCHDIAAQCEFDVINLAGRTSLKQLAAVLQKAHIVLSPDSGPAHLASSLGTLVVGLYAHSNPRRTGPYCHPELTVNAYDDCIKLQTGKNWNSLPWGTRAKGDNLMNSISTSDTIEKIDLAIQQLNTKNNE